MKFSQRSKFLLLCLLILLNIVIIIPSVPHPIGDDSFAHYHMGQVLNDSQISFWFRISNIIGLIKVPYDYSFTYELTEIVEQRIYDSAI